MRRGTEQGGSWPIAQTGMHVAETREEERKRGRGEEGKKEGKADGWRQSTVNQSLCTDEEVDSETEVNHGRHHLWWKFVCSSLILKLRSRECLASTSKRYTSTTPKPKSRIA